MAFNACSLVYLPACPPAIHTHRHGAREPDKYIKPIVIWYFTVAKHFSRSWKSLILLFRIGCISCQFLPCLIVRMFVKRLRYKMCCSSKTISTSKNASFFPLIHFVSHNWLAFVAMTFTICQRIVAWLEAFYSVRINWLLSFQKFAIRIQDKMDDDSKKAQRNYVNINVESVDHCLNAKIIGKCTRLEISVTD